MSSLHPTIARVTERIVERSKGARRRYLELMAAEGLTPKTYNAGSWGPSAAIALAERDGVSWHE